MRAPIGNLFAVLLSYLLFIFDTEVWIGLDLLNIIILFRHLNILRHLRHHFSICVSDVKPKLHFALYGYVSLWSLTSIKPLMIALNVLEALGRLANHTKIVIDI